MNAHGFSEKIAIIPAHQGSMDGDVYHRAVVMLTIFVINLLAVDQTSRVVRFK